MKYPVASTFTSSGLLVSRWANSAMAGMLLGLLAVVPDASAITCNVNNKVVGEWKAVVPEGGEAGNGTVVAEMTVSRGYRVTNSNGEDIKITHQTGTFGTAENYYAIPVSSMPGLGVRLLWEGESTLPVAALSRINRWPLGVISDSGMKTLLTASGMINNSSFTFFGDFKFQLVVINEKVYSGGHLSFKGSSFPMNMMLFTTGANNTLCGTEGMFDISNGLLGELDLNLPLPKPNLPTCQFDVATLNQRVSLPEMPVRRVVAEGRPREEGSLGQKTFTLAATDCGSTPGSGEATATGTRFAVYFTDARNQGAIASHLSTTKPGVGIRLYGPNGIEPLKVGPAPTGSSIPTNGLWVTTAPNEAIHNVEFTAQYVDTAEAAITAGDLDASAIITVVYP